MKTLKFENFTPFKKMLNKMGTKSNYEYKFQGLWDHISREELKILSTRGIELTVEQLENCICEDGTFEWKGQKVLVYIKEQWLKGNYSEPVYKYHISNCRTQIQMRNQGKINRYVISTRFDGGFEVTFRHPLTRKVTNENPYPSW